MIPDEAEGALGECAGADIKVPGIAGAKTQGSVGEAVLGDMLVGGGEDSLLGSSEWAGGRRVVV